MLKWTLWILIFCAPLYSLEYGMDAKHEGSIPITKFAIFSERCTGSNYVRNLVKDNIAITLSPFGHKHFPPWFSLPQSAWLGDPKLYTYDDTDDYLFIILFRDPYQWLQSFHNNPHHAKGSIRKLSFSNFVRTRWVLNQRDPVVIAQRAFNPLLDKNPDDGSLFPNVMKLRSAKIENMLKIKNKAKNVYILNYETVRDHPQEVLAEIANLFQLDLNSDFRGVEDYKGDPNQGLYRPSIYPSITGKNLQYINSQLDWALEDRIGYIKS